MYLFTYYFLVGNVFLSSVIISIAAVLLNRVVVGSNGDISPNVGDVTD